MGRPIKSGSLLLTHLPLVRLRRQQTLIPLPAWHESLNLALRWRHPTTPRLIEEEKDYYCKNEEHTAARCMRPGRLYSAVSGLLQEVTLVESYLETYWPPPKPRLEAKSH